MEEKQKICFFLKSTEHHKNKVLRCFGVFCVHQDRTLPKNAKSFRKTCADPCSPLLGFWDLLRCQFYRVLSSLYWELVSGMVKKTCFDNMQLFFGGYFCFFGHLTSPNLPFIFVFFFFLGGGVFVLLSGDTKGQLFLSVLLSCFLFLNFSLSKSLPQTSPF